MGATENLVDEDLKRRENEETATAQQKRKLLIISAALLMRQHEAAYSLPILLWLSNDPDA